MTVVGRGLIEGPTIPFMEETGAHMMTGYRVHVTHFAHPSNS